MNQFAQLRESMGLTLQQAADLWGVSASSVWLWEKGRADPRPELWLHMARVQEKWAVTNPGSRSRLAEDFVANCHALGIRSARDHFMQRLGVVQQK